MPGEPLMCVWQAVLAKDVFRESGVKRATVMSVVENFEGIENVRYSERRFKEVFTESKVKFPDFLAYVSDNLRAPGVPLPLLINDMERKCWGMAEDSYRSEALNQQDLFKMWTIFNRLCQVDSYPPVMSKQQTNYLFERVAQNIKKTWGSSDTIPEEGLTFQQVIDDLDRTYFSVTSTMLVRQCIEDIHSWLVREVMKTGILHKRTRKSANWTNWQKRWFVMSPGRLEYYHHEKRRDKKGEVIIDTKTEVAILSDYKSVLSKMENRFKVSNRPTLEIELCAVSKEEKEDWIKTIKNNVKAMQDGVTPQMRLLKQRDQLSKEKRSDSLLKTEKELNAAEELAKSVSALDIEKPADAPKPKVDVKVEVEVLEDEDGVYDNNMFEVQKEKIKAVFFNIDKDGNGRVDKDEFAAFILGLGAHMERKEIDLIFGMIDVDKNQFICLGEFIDYFVHFVMEKSLDSNTEAKLRRAFMKADRDGSGAVNFREFSEYAYSKRRSMAIDNMMLAFDQLDKEGKGEIQFEDFKKFIKNEPAFADLETTRKSQNVEMILRGNYEATDASKLASYLRTRWNAFASFKRVGAKGELVMKGGHGMVDDVVPGSYNLVDLACFNDLPPIKPKHIAVKVNWVPSGYPGRSGRAIFPEDFDGLLPTEIATSEHLAYYGASLADGNQLQVSLLYRHGIQDFTYENTYLEDYVTADKAMGGAGIEHHEFSHLDCPLEESSGFFVMGKFEDDLLHLTAFKVPTRHTIYVPSGVIHSNDYLKGTWRTMLSDEVEVNHVQLVKIRREGDTEQVKHFSFSFAPLV